MISESFTLLSAACALVIALVFAGLVWAAVQDGQDERRFRARRIGARPVDDVCGNTSEDEAAVAVRSALGRTGTSAGPGQRSRRR